MSTSSHSPSSSVSSTSSTGALPYTWIMEHLLMYPGTYELPLRTMYAVNRSAQDQLQPTLSWSSSALKTAGLSGDPAADNTTGLLTLNIDQQQEAANIAAAQLRANMMAQLAQLPTQKCSLPASFITSFVRRCFPEELIEVDFPHALTAMEYLQSLEARRTREKTSVMKRLGLTEDQAVVITESSSDTEKAVAEWVKTIRDAARKVEALYTQCFVALRRWTMINEMSLVPFSKPNCLALLNTLFPPFDGILPTRQLTAKTLENQRVSFLRYIEAVERGGPEVLGNLMKHGGKPERGDINGWRSVSEIVDMYLRGSNNLIEQCTAVIGIESILQNGSAGAHKRNKHRPNVDSGVSFITEDRPSTASSRNLRDKPLPPSPVAVVDPSPMTAIPSPIITRPALTTSADPSPTAPAASAPIPKNFGSKLEKIAREIRKFYGGASKKESSKTESAAKEVKRAESKDDSNANTDTKPKLKGLKKMKSMTAMGDKNLWKGGFFNSAGGSGSGDSQPNSPLSADYPTFSLDDEGRRQAIEAATRRLKPQKSRPLMRVDI